MAGADVATSASYQASFQGFARRGMDAHAATDLMHLSVVLAQSARDDFWADSANRVGRERPLVAASVGSYGAFLADGSEYRGDYGLSVEALMDWHRPRMAALVAAGPDLLACETIPSLAEGQALVNLLAEFAPMPAWLAFSCGDAAHVCHGEPFRLCVALAEESEQVVAVGLNCTPPSYVESLLRSAAGPRPSPCWSIPTAAKAGTPSTAAGCPARASPSLANPPAAARLIGGCCRTGPAGYSGGPTLALSAGPRLNTTPADSRPIRAGGFARRSRIYLRVTDPA